MDNPQGGQRKFTLLYHFLQSIYPINDLEAFGSNLSNMMHTELNTQTQCVCVCVCVRAHSFMIPTLKLLGTCNFWDGTPIK